MLLGGGGGLFALNAIPATLVREFGVSRFRV